MLPQKPRRRLFENTGAFAKEHIVSVLFLSLLCTGALTCGIGPINSRRRIHRKVAPLIFKQHIPNVPENSLAASGPSEKKIRRGDDRFKDLIPNYNKDIVFRDRSADGADRLATQRLTERLNTLAISVMNQWPGVKLRVVEGFDEDGYHVPTSLHYSGRAVDITTSDRDPTKYGMLAGLAVDAGFDWVYYESRSHVHCSVKKDSAANRKHNGCFHGSSSIKTRHGSKIISQLTEGDEIASGVDKNGFLTYSKVIAFLHRNQHMTTNFTRLQIANGQNLLLTSNHLIFRLTQNHPTAIHASLVKPGDFVYTRTLTDEISVSKVTNVDFLMLTGVYAPLTVEGTLFVDGVWVSCYALVTSHEFAHAVLSPVRLIHVVYDWITDLQEMFFQKGIATTGSPVNMSASVATNDNREYIHWYAKVLGLVVSPFFD